MDLDNFESARLEFSSNTFSDVFALKNNKTLGETIRTKRYEKFGNKVNLEHSERMEEPLGDFLLSLKNSDNLFYANFLNKYGDLAYCEFKLVEEKFLNSRGLYAFYADDKLKYIGRCRDTFKKRINQGYGKIHPKNCYIDGQATNCHVNNLILQSMNSVTFKVLPIDDICRIESLERCLIEDIGPEWNIALKP